MTCDGSKTLHELDDKQLLSVLTEIASTQNRKSVMIRLARLVA